MKTNENKAIEKLADKIMMEHALDSPSPGFTSNVMSKVLAITTSKTTTYTPLISRPVLILIFASIILLFIYLLTRSGETSGSLFTSINYPKINFAKWDTGFKFSNITLYAALCCVTIFFIQIPLLKYHFEKQLEK